VTLTLTLTVTVIMTVTVTVTVNLTANVIMTVTVTVKAIEDGRPSSCNDLIKLIQSDSDGSCSLFTQSRRLLTRLVTNMTGSTPMDLKPSVRAMKKLAKGLG
jgi:hypothetical protein